MALGGPLTGLPYGRAAGRAGGTVVLGLAVGFPHQRQGLLDVEVVVGGGCPGRGAGGGHPASGALGPPPFALFPAASFSSSQRTASAAALRAASATASGVPAPRAAA